MAYVKYFVLVLVISVLAMPAYADDDALSAHVSLYNHVFDPQTIFVPAGKKIKLTITNKDPSPAEFESDDLRREKVIPANGEIYIYIGPLDSGTYMIFDDFHHATTSAKIVAKE